MKHFASPKFWVCYKALPKDVRDLADKNFELLKANPKHPSLHFKQIGNFGRRASGNIIARLDWIKKKELFGFGLALTRLTANLFRRKYANFYRLHNFSFLLFGNWLQRLGVSSADKKYASDHQSRRHLYHQ